MGTGGGLGRGRPWRRARLRACPTTAGHSTSPNMCSRHANCSRTSSMVKRSGPFIARRIATGPSLEWVLELSLYARAAVRRNLRLVARPGDPATDRARRRLVGRGRSPASRRCGPAAATTERSVLLTNGRIHRAQVPIASLAASVNSRPGRPSAACAWLRASHESTPERRSPRHRHPS